MPAISGRGHLGVTRIKVGPKELSVAAVALPTIQGEPEIGDGWVRFKQTAGGRTGAPAPRRVRGKPFFRISSAIAWTTLALTIKADGSSEHELAGASPFPRHWVYDKDGKLVQKSGTIDFEQWYRESHGENTPWGSEETEAFVTEAESALERELSRTIMRSGATSKPKQLQVDETLTEQGETGDGIYLLLDGILAVEVDGETIAEVGPGAVLGATRAGRGRPADGDPAGRYAREGRGRERRRHRAIGARGAGRSAPARGGKARDGRSGSRRARGRPVRRGASRRAACRRRGRRAPTGSRRAGCRDSPRSRAFDDEAPHDRQRIALLVELPERVVVLARAGGAEGDHLAVAAHRLELQGLDGEPGGEPRGGERVVGEARSHEREPTPT